MSDDPTPTLPVDADNYAVRILLEVRRGILTSEDDTSEQADYRKRVAIDADQIARSGGIIDIPCD